MQFADLWLNTLPPGVPRGIYKGYGGAKVGTSSVSIRMGLGGQLKALHMEYDTAMKRSVCVCAHAHVYKRNT